MQVAGNLRVKGKVFKWIGLLNGKYLSIKFLPIITIITI